MNKLTRILCFTLCSLFSISLSAQGNNLLTKATLAEKSNNTAQVKLPVKDVLNISAININNADEAALASLKGIGIKRAKAIISYRQNQGKFKSLEELLNVKGIGEQFLVKNKARLRI